MHFVHFNAILGVKVQLFSLLKQMFSHITREMLLASESDEDGGCRPWSSRVRYIEFGFQRSLRILLAGAADIFSGR